MDKHGEVKWKPQLLQPTFSQDTVIQNDVNKEQQILRFEPLEQIHELINDQSFQPNIEAAELNKYMLYYY